MNYKKKSMVLARVLGAFLLLQCAGALTGEAMAAEKSAVTSTTEKNHDVASHEKGTVESTKATANKETAETKNGKASKNSAKESEKTKDSDKGKDAKDHAEKGSVKDAKQSHDKPSSAPTKASKKDKNSYGKMNAAANSLHDNAHGMMATKSTVARSHSNTGDNRETGEFAARTENNFVNFSKEGAKGFHVQQITDALGNFVEENKEVLDDVKCTLMEYRKSCQKAHEKDFKGKDWRKVLGIDRLDTSSLQEMYETIRALDPNEMPVGPFDPMAFAPNAQGHKMVGIEAYKNYYPMGHGFAAERSESFGGHGFSLGSIAPKASAYNLATIVDTAKTEVTPSQEEPSDIDSAVENVKEEIVSLKKQFVAMLLHKKA